MGQNNSNGSASKRDQNDISEMDSAALLSHDLRSAVSDIIGGLQLLDLSGLDEGNRRQVERISASAGLLYRLLEKSTSSDSGGELAADWHRATPIKISELLDTLEKRWSARAGEKGISLEFRLETEPGFLLNCSRLPLERLLANVLDNAIKNTDEGKISVISSAQDSSCVRFDVQDQGPGFSQDALDKLFSFGGRPVRSEKPGSGMGLFIAQQMVWRLNGTITVQNTSEGALVRIVLPLQDDGATSDRPVVLSAQQPQQRLAGMCVLLAEDNKTNQIAAGQMLRTLGAEVSVAADGVEAWNLLERQTFDFAVLDIEMPRKSGLELIRDIRARTDAMARIPLIALTAYVMREHRERILASGADGIIAKPLMDIDDFGESIEYILGIPAHMPANTRQEVAEPPSGPVDLNVYNSLRKTIGTEAFSELLEKLLDDLSMVKDRLQSAFANRDVNKARTASHVMISLAGAIGATRLQEVAQSLNTAANDGDGWKLSDFECRSLELLGELTVFLETALGEQKED
ncbi:MAG: response regulator [Rhodobacteraceae bacterium]|nr:response regulator [Paracoccaceae bacterium]